MHSCSGKTLKFLIVTINIIMFLVGLALAGVAGYTAFNKGSSLHEVIVKLKLPYAMTGVHILFAAGLILAFVAFLGCFAALQENNCMMGFYVFFIVLIIALEMAATIICFVKFKAIRNELLGVLRNSSNPKINESQNTGRDHKIAVELKKLLAEIEPEKKCCGINGPKDYGPAPPKTCMKVVQNIQSSKVGDAPLENNGELGGGEEEKVAQPSTNVKQQQQQQQQQQTYSSSTASSTTTSTTKSTTTEGTPSRSTSPSTITTTTEGTPPQPTTPSTTTISTTERKPLQSTISSTTIVTTTIPTTSAEKNATGKYPNTVTTKLPLASKKTVIAGSYYQTGCYYRIKPFLFAAAGIAIALMLIQVLVLVFAGCMICEIKDHGYSHID